MSTRWIAYVRPDGQVGEECRERSQVAGIVKARRAEGCTEIRVFKTADDARTARMSSHERATSTEQTEALAGGLVASQSIGIVGTFAGAAKKRRVA